MSSFPSNERERARDIQGADKFHGQNARRRSCLSADAGAVLNSEDALSNQTFGSLFYDGHFKVHAIRLSSEVTSPEKVVIVSDWDQLTDGTFLAN